MVRVTNHLGPRTAQKSESPNKNIANRIDVEDPETKPQPKKIKKYQSNTK
jgi:hypothetical protein